MASVSCVLSEDQLLCSICLEVFTDPVSTSCGHSFCKTCIYQHWDHSEQYQCPVCKEDFSSRPQLKTNTFMSEMVSQFRGPQEEPDHEESQDSSEAGGVPCDVCSEPRLRAVKSCLVCLASYCPTHLEPHRSTARLQRHHLICPVENLEERICQEHDKLLELFCKTEKKFICFQCTFSQHKDHPAVPLKEECERQQAELETLVKQRRQKIQEIQDSVKVNNKNADLEMAEGVKVFTDLMECVQKSLDQFKERITGDQKKVEDRASELIEKLEQEICVLQQRRADMKLVSEDHFSFIQTFSSVKPAPELEDWTQVKVSPQSYDGLVAQAVSELEKTLVPQIKKVSEAELRRVQQYEVDVTLDPDTVNSYLVLSHDNKQVKYKNVWMNYPDVPQRFSTTACVLGKQKFSSGRSYFQVQVKGKSWFLGVARESVERKEQVILSPQSGYWTIRLVDDHYDACADFALPLSLRTNPETVGVFVDHDQGLVSFYDVDSADLLYSFTHCSFSGNILVFLAPQFNNNRKNSAPLILTPVSKK
ncbi:E3 ubiquitin-protein ligase TRIM21-like [Boleophthalmus pectinirostris]|uniref:E3 ubiquitin-protein ligase TRIM21-like n=1 Tax=Boleophthalmus pectinirostris TaxID=150288 RepID=UPI002431BBB6|nr:E3 ubiquitin-protein ligase TRIM21-like [Boleophthalmus pectinirostris]